jgi:transcriptional regulator with XRE-family HTH domain
MSKSLVELVKDGTVVFTFGELVRKAREDAGLKQSDLAVKMRVSRTAIAAWENGTNRPNYWTIVRLAEITEKPLRFFPDELGNPLSTWRQHSGTRQPIAA